MDELPFISLFEPIPISSIGIFCGLIPTIVAYWKKWWELGIFILARSVGVGNLWGWLAASSVCILLFLFAVMSPPSATGIVSITVFLAIAGIFLYAIEIRFRDFNEKTELPSFIAVFGGRRLECRWGASQFHLIRRAKYHGSSRIFRWIECNDCP